MNCYVRLSLSLSLSLSLLVKVPQPPCVRFLIDDAAVGFRGVCGGALFRFTHIWLSIGNGRVREWGGEGRGGGFSFCGFFSFLQCQKCDWLLHIYQS